MQIPIFLLSYNKPKRFFSPGGLGNKNFAWEG